MGVWEEIEKGLNVATLGGYGAVKGMAGGPPKTAGYDTSGLQRRADAFGQYVPHSQEAVANPIEARNAERARRELLLPEGARFHDDRAYNNYRSESYRPVSQNIAQSEVAAMQNAPGLGFGETGAGLGGSYDVKEGTLGLREMAPIKFDGRNFYLGEGASSEATSAPGGSGALSPYVYDAAPSPWASEQAAAIRGQSVDPTETRALSMEAAQAMRARAQAPVTTAERAAALQAEVIQRQAASAIASQRGQYNPALAAATMRASSDAQAQLGGQAAVAASQERMQAERDYATAIAQQQAGDVRQQYGLGSLAQQQETLGLQAAMEQQRAAQEGYRIHAMDYPLAIAGIDASALEAERVRQAQQYQQQLGAGVGLATTALGYATGGPAGGAAGGVIGERLSPQIGYTDGIQPIGTV